MSLSRFAARLASARRSYQQRQRAARLRSAPSRRWPRLGFESLEERQLLASDVNLVADINTTLNTLTSFSGDLVAVDFTGDGRPDVVTANAAGAGVSFLLNTP